MSIILDLALIGHNFDATREGYEDWILTKSFRKELVEGFYPDPQLLVDMQAIGFLARIQQSWLQISITCAGRDSFKRAVMKYRKYATLPSGFSAEEAVGVALDTILTPDDKPPDGALDLPLLIEPIVIDNLSAVERSLHSKVQLIVVAPEISRVRDVFLCLAMRASDGVTISVLAVQGGADQIQPEGCTMNEQEFLDFSVAALKSRDIQATGKPTEEPLEVTSPIDNPILAPFVEAQEVGTPFETTRPPEMGLEASHKLIDNEQATLKSQNWDKAYQQQSSYIIGRIGNGEFLVYSRKLDGLLSSRLSILGKSRRERILNEHRAISERLRQAQDELSNHSLGEPSFVLHERYFRLLLYFHVLYVKNDLSMRADEEKIDFTDRVRGQCVDRVELEVEGLAAFWRWLLPFGRDESGFRGVLVEFCVSVFSLLLRKELGA